MKDKPFMPMTIEAFEDGSYRFSLGPYSTVLSPNDKGELNFIDLDTWATHILTSEAEKFELRQRLLGK